MMSNIRCVEMIRNVRMKPTERWLKLLILWRGRQWGHADVRSAIAAKQKLGLGGAGSISKAMNKKNLKRRRVRRI